MFGFIFLPEVGFFYFASDHTSWLKSALTDDTSPEDLDIRFQCAVFDPGTSLDSHSTFYDYTTQMTKWSDGDLVTESTVVDDACGVYGIHAKCIVWKFFFSLSECEIKSRYDKRFYFYHIVL